MTRDLDSRYELEIRATLTHKAPAQFLQYKTPILIILQIDNSRRSNIKNIPLDNLTYRAIIQEETTNEASNIQLKTGN